MHITTDKTTMKHFTEADVNHIMDRFHYTDETKKIIKDENLLPIGVLSRLQHNYPHITSFKEEAEFLFNDKKHYAGVTGFREIVGILSKNGINIDHLEERELFIHVYRFMATKHVLNNINWKKFEKDSLFQLVFPQPGMIRPDIAKKYLAAKTEAEKKQIIDDYIEETNPHDGKQKLNKPSFVNADGATELIEGSQHKYPPCMLIFDQHTQNCFAFCSYCFRHAQVRGDEDMFLQEHVDQIHRYLKMHKEVSDVLITGGDAGYISPERLAEYIEPIISDPDLSHVKTIRLGTRVLTFNPEMLLTKAYDKMLALFKKLYDNGIQLVFMSHFSTPREVLNISTIAAIRRLKSVGVTVKSQSPIMHHISLFSDENGKIDVDRSAQNWIDLGNVLATLGVGFHSMYCARPTGEHHYFTVPLAEINKIFSKVYKNLASINRPTRYITMTSSGGKISLLGTTEIKGEKLFVLKFNEGRNMDWMDTVYLAKYDEMENTIANLKPYEGSKHFYEDELYEIEHKLETNIASLRENEEMDE